MHWLSFAAGFVAFPILGLFVAFVLMKVGGVWNPEPHRGERDVNGRLL